MHKAFISYHHANDQGYKEELLRLNANRIFIDGSVSTNDISDELSDQAIRQKIRDDYLRDTTVTILLVGTGTKGRKHIDWELYSSMLDGAVNKKSGILVINLPSTGSTTFTAAHGDTEKQSVYPDHREWISITSFAEYERRYPFIPPRILDNLVTGKSKISVTNWDRIVNNLGRLSLLIEATHQDRAVAAYDFSRPMRRNNA